MAHFDDACFLLEMEDREALKRQIELLQNLINSHKSVHGDTPSRVGDWRPPGPVPARGRRAQISAPFPGQTQPYGPAPAGHWRKKYSLSNKPSSSTTVPADHTQRPAPGSLGSLSNKPSSSTVPANPTQRPAPVSLGSLSNKPSSSTVPANPAQRPAPVSLGSLSNKLSSSTVPANTALRPAPGSLGSLSNKPSSSTVPGNPAQCPAPGSLGSHSNKPSSSTVPGNPAQRPAPVSLGSLSNKTSASITTHSPHGPASKSCAPPPQMRRSQASCPPVAGGPRASPSLTPGSLLTSPPHAAGGRGDPAPRVGRGRGRGLWGGKGVVAEVPPVGAGERGPPGAAGGERVGGAGGLPAESSLGQWRRGLGTRMGADSALQLKPRLQRRVNSAPKLAATPAVPVSSLPLPPPPPPHSRSLPRTAETPVAKGGVDKLKLLPSPSKSQFTWVKGSQGAPSPAPSPAVSLAPPPPSSARKTHRRPGSVAKTTKYTWVSSSSATRLPRKPLSPKALDTPQKAVVGGGARKPKSAATHAAKNKKGAGPTSPSQAHSSSRYRWKAIGQSPTVVPRGVARGGSRGVARGGSRGVARGGSVYRWTSEKENGPKRGSGPSPAPPQAGHTSPSPSPAGFKLRSRMKIIRRRSLNSSPGVLTVTSRYALRRRTSLSGRGGPGGSGRGGPGGSSRAGQSSGRRAPARGLVSISKHKLRRVPPSPPAAGPRTGSSSSVLCPGGQRVIRTRYKITRRPGPAHSATLSLALSWRAKRLQSARALLQSRLRTSPDRPPSSQPWRGRGMRWIGGALYRVSANKLCRTAPASSSASSPAPRQRAGRSVWADGGGRGASVWDSSRAVQRSLAIVRQARQRKQRQRQYCMYYNRFGKCNRGNACPYIHDPDKVAVCTRFLRGTCKQTDGSCSFSHKVSKDKMPVCSYFLKGICNNSNCPYSHVYVSRSAAVCQDFVRGYCPKGEKCKLKHTLQCPDFSSRGCCPRGSKCKLQHRQRLKRTKSHPPSAPPKRPRTQEALPRLEAAGLSGEAPASTGPEKLPSFISLASSPELPEEEEEPGTPTAPGSGVTEKKLQIKPRF